MSDNFHKSLKKNNLPPEKPAPEFRRLLSCSCCWHPLAACTSKAPPDKVEARRIKLSTLGTPTEVAVSASNRRLTVAWDEMPGATNYKIAA